MNDSNGNSADINGIDHDSNESYTIMKFWRAVQVLDATCNVIEGREGMQTALDHICSQAELL